MQSIIALILLLQAAVPADGTKAEPLAETITVTAARRPSRLGDTPASTVVVRREEIDASASQNADDVLRQVPGFALFRRTGSRTANPTSQGVSLRGLAGSGASRALVLDDGIPVNDAFGGWISWSRIALPAVERIEVVRGGVSELYGSSAVGGVINLVRRRGELTAADLSYASDGTTDASVHSGLRRGRWHARANGRYFDTPGYIAISPGDRGSIDTEVTSRSWSGELAADLEQDAARRWFLRLARFEEQRSNGTPLQTNATNFAQASGGGDLTTAQATLAMRAYATRQDYRQTFTAVDASRGSERLTREQRVPSDSIGISAVSAFAPRWSAKHTMTAGLDAVRVKGISRERAPGSAVAAAGGVQQIGGLFFTDFVSITPRLSAVLALRHDRWSNDPEGAGEERRDSATSPRASLQFRPRPSLALSASFYRAFRAPTLNELYRAFRVGNVLTLANEDLAAERASGRELGMLWSPSPRNTVRATLYDMRLADPVSNVTLTATPALITRQRQNLGSIRARGLEVDAATAIGTRVHLSAGYLVAATTIESFAANRELEGNSVPQVPRHQLTSQARFEFPRASFSLQGRTSSAQYDDDQNRLRLDAATVIDAILSLPLGSMQPYVAVENAFDERYDTGRTPLRTIGPGRTVRLGLRIVAGKQPAD